MNDAQAVAQALNTWSLVVQVAVVTVMALVFFELWLSSRREVVLSWDLAWLLDLGALLSVLAVASWNAALSPIAGLAFYLVYAASKIGFAALLVLGLEQFHRRRRAIGENAWRGVAVLLVVLFAVVLVTRPPTVAIQATVYVIVALLMAYGGLSSLFQRGERGTPLLPAAFLIHGAVFFHHGLALLPFFRGRNVPKYMSHISFIDAGVELFLGVVLLLALGNSAVEEMARTNARLEAAQRWLRDLVDADPLTGLYNRRRLRRFIAGVAGSGGVLIYMDVDRFKSINDRWGHGAGDACLRRVADGLREVFRTEDGMFRMGGDEFLVVAPGLDPEGARERIIRLREILGRTVEGQPAVSVSVGIARFGEEMPVDRALASADHAMYREKEKHDR